MNKNIYILIMAGGEGTRFFPLSTPERPKQFMKFWGERTFIQRTFDRISGLVPAANIFVATNEKYLDLVKEQLPDISISNIIGETEKKNTAPCIAYTSRLIWERDKDAVIIVLPSDHVIFKETAFAQLLERGVSFASTHNALITLGLKPTWPADCFGYIKMGEVIENDPAEKWNAHAVERFVEKPSGDIAEKYLDEGTYVWNSGMFIWKSDVILKEIEKCLPSLNTLLDKYTVNSELQKFFHEAKSISIDYGVMERSDRVMIIPCDIGWSDIGTWESLYNFAKNNDVQLDPEIEKVMKEKLGL